MSQRAISEKLGCGPSIAFVAIFVAILPLWGWVTMTLWGWFAVPLGAPSLNLVQAMGLRVLIHAFAPIGANINKNAKAATRSDAIAAVNKMLSVPLSALAIGWLVHLWL